MYLNSLIINLSHSLIPVCTVFVFASATGLPTDADSGGGEDHRGGNKGKPNSGGGKVRQTIPFSQMS